MKHEDGPVPEILVTAGLIIAGLVINGQGSLTSSDKFSISITLGTLEIVFVFFRIISRQIKSMASHALPLIPRERMTDVIYQLLIQQREELLGRAQHLAEQGDVELEKHATYRELLAMTDVVVRFRAGSRRGTILAISSTNIEDFNEEPLAEAYLDANRDAVRNEVIVQRIFLIDDEQLHSRTVAAIIRKHDAALRKGAQGNTDGQAGVKWMLRTHAGADQNEDFALFANEAIVFQLLNGTRFELSQDPTKVARALETFYRLWHHSEAHTVAALPGGGYRR